MTRLWGWPRILQTKLHQSNARNGNRSGPRKKPHVGWIYGRERVDHPAEFTKRRSSTSSTTCRNRPVRVVPVNQNDWSRSIGMGRRNGPDWALRLRPQRLQGSAAVSVRSCSRWHSVADAAALGRSEQSLERGRRSCRAVMLAAAEMYVKGVSTRHVEKVLAEFGIEGLSSTQVSRAAALLDADLKAWRQRPLGCFRYIFLDARYEKTREHGVAGDCAVLTAIGVDELGRRRVLGVSIKVSEAEVHWRAFLESLVARGLQGLDFITSDDHAGLVPIRPGPPCGGWGDG